MISERRRLGLAAIAFGVAVSVAGSVQADLRKRIDAVLAGADARRMTVGVRVLELPAGKVLYSVRANEAFIPASNVKIITTASALHHLTPEFRFRTLIYADGTLAGGTLRGDLVIQGDGDPNISGRFHDDDIAFIPRQWAQILRRRGFRRITGDLVADDTIFDREYVCRSWPRDQLHKWYAAPVAGLSFNDGCVDVVITPSRAGRAARVALEPDTRYMHLTNGLITTASRALAKQRGIYLSRPLGTNRIVVKGRLWDKAGSRRYYVTVHEPPLYLATVVAEEMKRAGITLDGRVRLATKVRPRVERTDPRVHIIHSATLVDSINVTNKRSQSFYAEHLLKRTGAAVSGRGTFASGIDAAKRYLASAGIASGGAVIADGGGLSRANRLSPVHLTEVLKHAYNAKYGKVFVASLARSGIDHSMRKRLAATAYRGRVAAKTGTLNRVVALSGYAFNRHGKVLAFSVLVNNSHNNYAARAFTDEICRLLVDELIP